jgi:hypothetical protein
MHISRRYTKKFQPLVEGESVGGYESMGQACKDLSEVVDVLWLSGTRELAFFSCCLTLFALLISFWSLLTLNAWNLTAFTDVKLLICLCQRVFRSRIY